MLLVTLRAMVDGGMTVDDAMGAFGEVFKERRANFAEAVS